MTEQDWKYLEDNYSVYLPIKLLCDGFQITLEKHIDHKKDRLLNMLYVNGKFMGVWINNLDGHPESKFFYRRKTTNRLFSKEYLQKFAKRFDKDMAERLKPKPITTLTPFFPSFKAFKQHIIKTCKEILIIRD